MALVEQGVVDGMGLGVGFCISASVLASPGHGLNEKIVPLLL